jgi:hypothetical protein
MSTTGTPEGAAVRDGLRRSAIQARTSSRDWTTRALRQRDRTAKGQYVEVAMMDGVMNLCRVKFRDHQRLTRGPLTEYSVPTYQGMGEVPRAGERFGRRVNSANAIHASRMAQMIGYMWSCRRPYGRPSPSAWVRSAHAGHATDPRADRPSPNGARTTTHVDAYQ